MPFVSLFSKKIPFLKFIQFTKVFHICRFLVGCKASSRQMDVDFLVVRALTVHGIDAEEEDTGLFGLP